jgi:hypothetical protein
MRPVWRGDEGRGVRRCPIRAQTPETALVEEGGLAAYQDPDIPANRPLPAMSRHLPPNGRNSLGDWRSPVRIRAPRPRKGLETGLFSFQLPAANRLLEAKLEAEPPWPFGGTAGADAASCGPRARPGLDGYGDHHDQPVETRVNGLGLLLRVWRLRLVGTLRPFAAARLHI